MKRKRPTPSRAGFKTGGFHGQQQLNVVVIGILNITVQPFFVDSGFDVYEKVSDFVPEEINRRNSGTYSDEPANCEKQNFTPFHIYNSFFFV